MSKKMKNIARGSDAEGADLLSGGAGSQQDAGAKSGSKYYPVLIRKGRGNQHP